MRTFNFFIDDARYRIPTLAFVTAADDSRARVLAEQTLAESPHHLAIEVREAERLVFTLARDGAVWVRPMAPQPA